MSIRFYCPSGHCLSVSDKHAGETIRCPRCRQKVVVPAASAPDSANAEQLPKGEEGPAARKSTAEQPKSTQPEGKPPHKKPPPLPSARKSVAPTDDPTQPKQKPIPKVEVPDKPEEGHDDESVLDSEAPRKPQRGLKPQRASKQWLDAQPSKAPPNLPVSKTPRRTGHKAADEAKKPPPPKTKPAPPLEPALADEVHKQVADEQQEQPARRRKGRRDRKRSRREDHDEVPEAETASPEPPEPDAARPQPAQEAKPKKEPRRRGPKMMPPDVYRADRGSLVTVKGLAAVLALVVLFSLLPVGWLTAQRYFQGEPGAASGGEDEPLATAAREYESYINLETAPGWARVLILVAVLQLSYIAWMLAAPDWAGVWVVMVVFALVSTAYGMATAMAIAWPVEKPVPLGMEEGLRSSAKYWCGSVLALMSLATYLCGRTSARWRRTCELELAGRERARLRR